MLSKSFKIKIGTWVWVEFTDVNIIDNLGKCMHVYISLYTFIQLYIEFSLKALTSTIHCHMLPYIYGYHITLELYTLLLIKNMLLFH